jgi:hypothetical protein
MEYFILGVLFSPFVLAGVILTWAGSMMLLDAWRCRHPKLGPAGQRWAFQQRSIADEAQEWLRTRV